MAVFICPLPVAETRGLKWTCLTTAGGLYLRVDFELSAPKSLMVGPKRRIYKKKFSGDLDTGGTCEWPLDDSCWHSAKDLASGTCSAWLGGLFFSFLFFSFLFFSFLLCSLKSRLRAPATWHVATSVASVGCVGRPQPPNRSKPSS